MNPYTANRSEMLFTLTLEIGIKYQIEQANNTYILGYSLPTKRTIFCLLKKMNGMGDHLRQNNRLKIQNIIFCLMSII